MGVAAYELEEVEPGRVYDKRRYLPVTAVHAGRRREGLARLLVDSVIEDMQANGDRVVSWLVEPRKPRRSRSAGGPIATPMRPCPQRTSSTCGSPSLSERSAKINAAASGGGAAAGGPGV